MEQRIRDRYSDEILQEAVQRYGIAEVDIRLLDGFESFMYEFTRDGTAFILRLAHSFRRTPEQILGEVDWINYLARGGVSVARAVESPGGSLVERIPDGRGGEFLATSFVKAAGDHVSREQWNAALFRQYGALLGKMHRLTQGYDPPDPAWRRPHWNDPDMLEIESYLPPGHDGVITQYRALRDRLNTLPKDRAGYGLVHQDAHSGNFFVDSGGRIVLFDFDDCAYSWFINDIAIVFYYALNPNRHPDRFGETFVTPFLAGYRTENRLDKEWYLRVPDFLKLREIDMYALVHRSFGPDYVNDPWCARFMDGRKERIENCVPVMDVDWERTFSVDQC